MAPHQLQTRAISVHAWRTSKGCFCRTASLSPPGIPLTDASGAVGSASQPLAPPPVPMAVNPSALHSGQAPAPAPAPALPVPQAAIPSSSPAVLPSRLFNIDAMSPVHAMRGMPALAAAVDMVDDRENALGLGHRQADLASLREAHSQSQSFHADVGISAEAVGDGVEANTNELKTSPQDLGSIPGNQGEEEGIGTLVMFPSGRAKFLGRTAASEWLKNQETVAGPESPSPESRVPSPGPSGPHMNVKDTKLAFPFTTAAQSLSRHDLLAQLPPASDGRTLVDVYFRHFDWHFQIVSEAKVRSVFDGAYGLGDRRPHADELALLFSVLATGAYHNLELPPDDSSVDEYLHVAKCCLAKAEFFAHNTLACAQTLFIMFHLHLSLESGQNGDNAWPILGLVMRVVQAMGLHRDGKRWGLPDDMIEERRVVFWECYSSDLMASNNFCRPGSISPDFMDTAYPVLPEPGNTHALWQRARFELTSMFIDTLNHSMRVRPPPYSNVAVVNDRICAFERDILFVLKCRPVLVALPSAYADPEAAIAASPPTNKRNLHLTFQQFVLALNVSECLIHLHRPYFARALYESPKDPSRSRFGQSYLAMVERCNAIVVIASSLFSMYPQAAARHWFIWFHAFCSAACMGTLVLKNPHNVLAGFALSLVDCVIKIYGAVVKSRNSERMTKNLAWLVSMRTRLNVRLAQVGQGETPDHGVPGAGAGDEVDEDDLELLGWKTRLIERAEAGMRGRTINPSPRDNISPSTSAATSAPAVVDMGGPGGDLLLDQFWDSIAGQDGSLTMGDVGSINWWANGALGDGFGLEHQRRLTSGRGHRPSTLLAAS